MQRKYSCDKFLEYIAKYSYPSLFANREPDIKTNNQKKNIFCLKKTKLVLDRAYLRFIKTELL